MSFEKTRSHLNWEVASFVKRDFKPYFGQRKQLFKTHPVWQRLRGLGSELWLDTGSIDESRQLWTQEFSALTTNNTLLNKEVQTGRYDVLITQANDLLKRYPSLSEKQRILEFAFIINATHALKLVQMYDAYISVEEHTALADDVCLAVEYARRYHEICPERFIIKIPFTPAGLLSTRILSRQGIPVNHTLGFSARQNYLITRISKPAYVNVFLGRLNSFVIDNKLGNGNYIGEKATLASQAAVKNLRKVRNITTRQIGASFRSGKQISDLAGIDVMTMPPKVATEFLSLKESPDKITDHTSTYYYPAFNPGVDPASAAIDTLWRIDEKLITCLDALEKEDLDSFKPADLISFFKTYNCSDILYQWSDSQIAQSAAEGKIPKLENWKDALADGTVGLDTLMNLAGLNSFATDQKAMDGRVLEVRNLHAHSAG